jgi:hypothetical protein
MGWEVRPSSTNSVPISGRPDLGLPYTTIERERNGLIGTRKRERLNTYLGKTA